MLVSVPRCLSLDSIGGYKYLLQASSKYLSFLFPHPVLHILPWTRFFFFVWFPSFQVSFYARGCTKDNKHAIYITWHVFVCVHPQKQTAQVDIYVVHTSVAWCSSHVLMTLVVTVSRGQWSSAQWGFHSDKPTIGTSKKRRVCGSHVGLGATIPPWGWSGFRGWARICLGRYSNLGHSAGRERAPLTGWPHCSCIIIIFPVSHYAEIHGDCAPGSTSDSPATHTQTLTQGRGNVVTTAQVRGYHYKWLTLTFHRQTNHILYYTQTYVTPKPSLLPCYKIKHLMGGISFVLRRGPHFLTM